MNSSLNIALKFFLTTCCLHHMSASETFQKSSCIFALNESGIHSSIQETRLAGLSKATLSTEPLMCSHFSSSVLHLAQALFGPELRGSMNDASVLAVLVFVGVHCSLCIW